VKCTGCVRAIRGLQTLMCVMLHFFICLRDLGVDGWIILGWISRRWDVGIWTGLGWCRIETGCGRL